MKKVYTTPLITITLLTTRQPMLTTSGMPTLNNTEEADDSQVFSRRGGYNAWDDDEEGTDY